MGRIIRRTVTITITETWTITWTTDETSPPPATTVVPAQPPPQEEPVATLPTTLSAVDPVLHQLQGDATGETAAAAATLTPLEQANQAVVQRFYEEVVNQKKVEVFAEVFDPNMVEYSLGIGPMLTDMEMLAAFPDLHLTVDLWGVAGDLVTAVVTVSGTQQAAFMGVAPTGNTVSWTSIDIWRVKDGKITEVWHNFPSTDILAQIGYTLLPPTK